MRLLAAAAILVMAVLTHMHPCCADGLKREVEYLTPDGFEIHAEYLEGNTGAGLVLLLHQLGSDRSEYDALAGELNARGMHVLIPDARGHGESVMRDGRRVEWQDFEDSEFAGMRLDIEAAVGYAKSELGLADEPLGIAGSSIQSSTAIIYAKDNDRVRALVLLSPGLAYRGMDTEGPMRAYSGRPVFMAASEGDTRSRDAVRGLARYVGPDSGYWMVDGGSHGVGMFDEDPLLMKAVADWLELKLKAVK